MLSPIMDTRNNIQDTEFLDKLAGQWLKLSSVDSIAQEGPH